MSTDTSSRTPAPRDRTPRVIERVRPGTTTILSKGDWCFIVAPDTPTGLVSAKVTSISDDGLSATVQCTASGHLPFVRGHEYAGPLDIFIIARTQVFKRMGVTKIAGTTLGMTDRLTDYVGGFAATTEGDA